MNINPILNSDSYKLSHWLQYPPGTETVSAYVESRGGAYDRTLFFGLQAFLVDYLAKPITLADINDAEEISGMHGVPFFRAGWMHILNKHHGYLPIEVQAVAEGTVVKTGNVLVQIHNTDPACYWLTSYLETALLRAVWYPTTVATISYHAKQVIRRSLNTTSDDPEGQLPFKLHDFGARGVSSLESAALGGMAHLVNFKGSDTLAALLAARRYYGETMAGFSIPAAEHSTITSWGRNNEAAAYANMIKQFGKPGALFAVVSDSYDIFNAVENLWGGKLRQQVIDSGATLVVRPDSGNPAEVVLKTVTLLDKTFGSTINGKDFKVLNHVRVIQGDGIDGYTIGEILETLTSAGYAADNIAFGMGGALLQRLDRDTLKFAMKTSAAQIKGEWVDVYKDPITDPGKRSKRGRLALKRDAEEEIQTVLQGTCPFEDNLLVPVFRDGKILVTHSFREIRERSNISL